LKFFLAEHWFISSWWDAFQSRGIGYL